MRSGVTVYVHPVENSGSYVRLICPRCQKHRDYRDGRVVIAGRDLKGDDDKRKGPKQDVIS